MAGSVFEGLRVIDWTQVGAGPWTSLLFGYFGAEVIHVENPKAPDVLRSAVRHFGIPMELPGGRNSSFEAFNYNKKGITLDLSKEKGRQIMYQLVQKADVFVLNQVLDTVEKLGMGYDILSSYNPRLIWVSCTMYGPRGPDSRRAGFDPVGQARSGVFACSGEQGSRPVPSPVGSLDFVSALAAFGGAMTALFHRERTGEGQKVEVSQLQVGMGVVTVLPLATYLLLTEAQRKKSPYGGVLKFEKREETSNPGDNLYQCKDGRWVYVNWAWLEKFWRDAMKAIERLDLVDDPRFSDSFRRYENHKELICILDEVFATKTAEEWKERFKEVDCPFSVVQEIPDLLSDPQVIANDYLITFDHPDLGRVQYPPMPFTFGKVRGAVRTPAPFIGQHTEEILTEVLGYSWEEVVKLRDMGII